MTGHDDAAHAAIVARYDRERLEALRRERDGLRAKLAAQYATVTVPARDGDG